MDGTDNATASDVAEEFESVEVAETPSGTEVVQPETTYVEVVTTEAPAVQPEATATEAPPAQPEAQVQTGPTPEELAAQQAQAALEAQQAQAAIDAQAALDAQTADAAQELIEFYEEQ